MKTIQRTLDGTFVEKEKNLKEDKIFIACVIMLSAKIGYTFKDILREFAKKAPLIRYKNEAGIKNVLEKMRGAGIIQMEGTYNGNKVTKISDDAQKRAREFYENIEELKKSKIFF